ncbi:hypothetical protein [Marinobacter salsuginis]|uniref:Uncharacterized protein n=1 Tax=Marinobacter salsuginis TaxID=418719 RepID=A0A5M3Q1Q7_9GAMM|nr:hypothetical protein [Marinobacter salsuginis]GBO89195.1 hypothetical protein MSSD14B_28630 [Marinobacter salsuginis]
MRYTINLNSVEQRADTLDAVLTILADFTDFDRAAITQDILYNGAASVLSGPDTALVVDTMYKAAKQARECARKMYARDGEVEFADDLPVERTEDGYRVMCWAWVDAADAGCDDLDEDADEDNVELAYISAASHIDVEFDEHSVASLGDDPGAYVSGWVEVSFADVEIKAQ